MQYSSVTIEAKSPLIHEYSKVKETDLCQVSPEGFDLDSLVRAGSVAAKNLMYSGLTQAGFFPIATQSLEFVLACIKHYDPESREVRAVDGRVIASLKPDDIEFSFGIPPFEESLTLDLEDCDRVWSSNVDKCQKVAFKWLKDKRSTLPRNVGRGEFIDEYAIMITLLNRISKDIALELATWKEKLLNIEKYVIDFIQHIACRYFTNEGINCLVHDLQNEFVWLIHERFCGDPHVTKMYLLAEIIVKFDRAEKEYMDLSKTMEDASVILQMKTVHLDSISIPNDAKVDELERNLNS